LRDDRIWIAWESQRRSLNLSARLQAPLFLCLDERRGWKRYPLSISKTVKKLAAMRGRTVMVQNPSMVLAALACLFKERFGYSLVVDRHSNFGYLAGGRAGWKRRLSDLLSDYTLRGADLTIVTNRELADRVGQAGGRAFVLPDPFPDSDPAGPSAEYPAAGEPRSQGSHTGTMRAPLEVLFVSSWAFDEPIAETIEACRKLQGEVTVRITGKVKPACAHLLKDAPPNFRPTGFLSDRDYFDLMARSDAVMAVTSRDATLVCGGYEGAAMGKPLILGDSEALREYFDSGCVYTDGTAEDLARQLRLLRAGLPAFTRAIRLFHARRKTEWDGRLAELEKLLDGRARRTSRPDG
jgi:glycosyltransferase involved in cell wall biosynthesis